MDIVITKASGLKEPFQISKLVKSLQRAGATPSLAQDIAEEIKANIKQGMTTKDIYKKAHRLLKRTSRPLAGRYHLKRGIMELGPSGFPFENYLSQILSELGYKVQIGKIINGKCVTHEIDVIAEKNNDHFMIECKYHNTPGMVCNVKIPLYIHARFKDVESQWQELPGHSSKFHQGWVVTNTRFTTDAITYGNCAGLKLISLDYPAKGSLRSMIEETGLYPLTCITSLTRQEKRTLLENNIVLCRDICRNPDYLNEFDIPAERLQSILDEADLLCHKLIQDDHH